MKTTIFLTTLFIGLGLALPAVEPRCTSPSAKGRPCYATIIDVPGLEDE